MTIKECINKKGIVVDCELSGSRIGTYEVQFINSSTGDDDFVTFDVTHPGTVSGNDKCAKLFSEFCIDEGIHQNTVDEIHITKASFCQLGSRRF